ncbi:MAG: UDP-glucose/GDP-mannose dehydrogenase family protein [Lautropia sp.]|nr:MAG: UDP-glucose/GDP-mannose dehydrogenase family protein [Pseudomonadota bacterium]MBC6960853.1 UDP-glucose/GDP-mannose dehydrogenase family protein [Lautropia sp.]MDL1908945.1 UDP-glucose/GDP-mannose dehydrogenase family protein [Betaproteobacteria bacterium PRO1]RIK85553.1 MAG: UDP-glucose 6-dehydrogenase [Burkholderiales bacterium]
MRLTVFGAGYVGLVTAACFAEMGNHVVCVDVDAERVARLSRGEVPIHEPGLAPLIERGLAQQRIRFTLDAADAMADAEVIFIAVGTPPGEDGSADLSHVLAVARTVGALLADRCVVVDKSTVPVGTADRVRETIAAELARRGVAHEFAVVSNPEFLKEGAAIGDFMRPDRIVIGSRDAWATEIMRALYAPFSRNHEKLIVMDVRSAELTKYAANTMLAVRISFMNELAALAERLGADIEDVRRGIGSDPRIGPGFLYPGAGFGGSCFPKDLRALLRTGLEYGAPLTIVQAAFDANERQKQVLFAKARRAFDGRLAGVRAALWGLAFKPDTDDIREAPSLELIESLLGAGATVVGYDPEAAANVRAALAGREGFRTEDDAYRAAEGADVLFVVTEWREFRSPDFARLRSIMRQPVLIDGRNLYDPQAVQAAGFRYDSIGRPALQAPK